MASDGKCPDIYECRLGNNKYIGEAMRGRAEITRLKEKLKNPPKPKPELTPRQYQCLITTLDEALGGLDNRGLATEYRAILKRLYKQMEYAKRYVRP